MSNTGSVGSSCNIREYGTCCSCNIGPAGTGQPLVHGFRCRRIYIADGIQPIHFSIVAGRLC